MFADIRSLLPAHRPGSRRPACWNGVENPVEIRGFFPTPAVSVETASMTGSVFPSFPRPFTETGSGQRRGFPVSCTTDLPQIHNPYYYCCSSSVMEKQK
jgi:hypothetical protein